MTPPKRHSSTDVSGANVSRIVTEWRTETSLYGAKVLKTRIVHYFQHESEVTYECEKVYPNPILERGQ